VCVLLQEENEEYEENERARRREERNKGRKDAADPHQLAHRDGRQTKKIAVLASLYGRFGSAPALGVTPLGVRKANAPPPLGFSLHQ
jgi:hypothetical protein